MDLVNLVETIVKSLVIHKDSVSVKEFPTEEENIPVALNGCGIEAKGTVLKDKVDLFCNARLVG